MAWHVAAFDVYGAHFQDVAIIDIVCRQVVHALHGEAHHGAIGFGLAEQFFPFAMHGDGQGEALAAFAQAADMVHMGVGEEQEGGCEALAVEELV